MKRKPWKWNKQIESEQLSNCLFFLVLFIYVEGGFLFDTNIFLYPIAMLFWRSDDGIVG